MTWDDFYAALNELLEGQPTNDLLNQVNELAEEYAAAEVTRNTEELEAKVRSLEGELLLLRWKQRGDTPRQVIYYPMQTEDGKFLHGRRTWTRGEAFMSDSGYPVIFLRDVSGYVSLRHVFLRPNYPTSAGPFDVNFNHLWDLDEQEATHG